MLNFYGADTSSNDRFAAFVTEHIDELRWHLEHPEQLTKLSEEKRAIALAILRQHNLKKREQAQK